LHSPAFHEPVALTAEGKRAWIEFYNRHAQEQVELTGDLAAAYSKRRRR